MIRIATLKILPKTFLDGLILMHSSSSPLWLLLLTFDTWSGEGNPCSTFSVKHCFQPLKHCKPFSAFLLHAPVVPQVIACDE
ncbi:protein of unknown function [Streptomyces murinus]